MSRTRGRAGSSLTGAKAGSGGGLVSFAWPHDARGADSRAVPSKTARRIFMVGLRGEGRRAVMFTKIVSGGQTGVDRAALDVALELGVKCGGWCPQGRRAEDGRIDERYPLQETPWDGYPQRTEWNVRDSDGTLILTCGEPDRGTALTIELVQRKKKP